MGQSTDGILCYGFCLNENGEYPWQHEDDEFEDYLAKLEGLLEPSMPYASDTKAWEKYWSKKGRLKAELGVTLVYHCSVDFPMYILAATDSKVRASRGYPEMLGQTLHIGMYWKEDLYQFCKRAGIEFKDPQWILCSMWG